MGLNGLIAVIIVQVLASLLSLIVGLVVMLIILWYLLRHRVRVYFGKGNEYDSSVSSATAASRLFP